MYSKRYILESLMLIGEYEEDEMLGDYGEVRCKPHSIAIKPAHLEEIAKGVHLIVKDHVIDDGDIILVRENDLVLTDLNNITHICNPLGTITGMSGSHFMHSLKDNIENSIKETLNSKYTTLNFIMNNGNYTEIILNIPDIPIKNLKKLKKLIRKAITKASNELYEDMNLLIDLAVTDDLFINKIYIELFTKDSLVEESISFIIDTPLARLVGGELNV